MRWWFRILHNEKAVQVWLNILDTEYNVTPDKIKVSGLTVYYYNDVEI